MADLIIADHYPPYAYTTPEAWDGYGMDWEYPGPDKSIFLRCPLACGMGTHGGCGCRRLHDIRFLQHPHQRLDACAALHGCMVARTRGTDSGAHNRVCCD